VSLLQLLGLLLVLLFQLLCLSVVGSLLMFVVLFLLKLLPLLRLLGNQLVLLLFILPVCLCISGVDSRGAGNWCKIARMHSRMRVS